MAGINMGMALLSSGCHHYHHGTECSTAHKVSWVGSPVGLVAGRVVSVSVCSSFGF